MIGKLFSTGIELKYGCGGHKAGGQEYYGWWAKVCFEDYGLTEKGSVYGFISNKYAEPIEDAIDTVKADAERMGIEFISISTRKASMLYYDHDGESKEFPPPDNWKQILKEQAERIGWETYE
jgi:hypothetical protein